MRSASPPAPPPLAPFPAFDTRNPDFAVNAIKTNFHQADVDIPKTRNYRSLYNFLDLGRVSLHYANFTSGFQIRSEPTQTDLVLIRLFRGNLCMTSGKRRFFISPGKRAAMLDFNQRTAIYQEEGYENITTRILRPGLEQALTRLTGVRCVAPLAFTPELNLTEPGPRRLLNVLDRVVDLFSHDSGIREVPLLVAQSEELLLTALLTCLEHNYSHVFRREERPAPPRIVRLVEDYIEANADKPLRMADLADLTGMSARSIQAAFQKNRGYSPSLFLRERRLARARQTLLQAPPGATVMSVALSCGFASHSVFSRLYRERFGEYPSATLRNGA